MAVHPAGFSVGKGLRFRVVKGLGGLGIRVVGD